MQQESEELLSVGTAAKIAKIDRSSLSRAIKDHRLPGIWTGTSWVVKRGDLEAWMASPDYHPGPGRPRRKNNPQTP